MLSDSVVSLDSHDECEGTASLEEPPVGGEPAAGERRSPAQDHAAPAGSDNNSVSSGRLAPLYSTFSLRLLLRLAMGFLLP